MIDVNEARKILSEATSGWCEERIYFLLRHGDKHDGPWNEDDTCDHEEFACDIPDRKDAKAIVYLRNHAIELLDEIENLQEGINRLTRMLMDVSVASDGTEQFSGMAAGLMVRFFASIFAQHPEAENYVTATYKLPSTEQEGEDEEFEVTVARHGAKKSPSIVIKELEGEIERLRAKLKSFCTACHGTGVRAAYVDGREIECEACPS